VDPTSIWLRIHASLTRVPTARSERGASLVEYALLVSLIALVCFVAVSFIGTDTKAPLTSVGSSLLLGP